MNIQTFDQEFVEWCEEYGVTKEALGRAAENATTILNLCTIAGLSHADVDASKSPLADLIAEAFERKYSERKPAG